MLINNLRADKKSLETVFSIATWRQMAIKNSVSKDFYLPSEIVLTFLIAAYSVWYSYHFFRRVNYKDAEQTVPKHRLICIFVFFVQQIL